MLWTRLGIVAVLVARHVVVLDVEGAVVTEPVGAAELVEAAAVEVSAAVTDL